MRIAVFGAGFIGRRHIDNLQMMAGFTLAGVVDPSETAGAWLKDRGIAHYTDQRELLDKERPDGVVIATPNQFHEPAALLCLGRGVPVLIEKPIADTLDAAARIAKAAQDSGVPVLIGHHRRHNPLMRAAKAFIDEGGLGKIVAVNGMELRRKPDSWYASAWKSQAGAGPILINTIHDVDCLRYLCGEVVELFAYTANMARGLPMEDSAAITMRFAGGAVGTFTMSDAVPAPWAWSVAAHEDPRFPLGDEDCYLICGTEACLAIPTLMLWRNEGGGGRGDPFVRKRLFYETGDPWTAEMQHFAEVIRGEVRPLVDAEDGLRTLATTMAIHLSAETRQLVAIDSIIPA